MSQNLPFQNSDPANRSFQYLEDLATAYWYSEVLFAAIELGLFDLIESKITTTEELALRTNCNPQKLNRLLKVLEKIELIGYFEENWYNCYLTSLYLIKEKTSYLGAFLLYRRYMQPGWKEILDSLSLDTEEKQILSNQEIKEKIFNYVKALDGLAKVKSKEIITLLKPVRLKGPILDIGGGAGALGRAFLSHGSFQHQAELDNVCDLLELPDVIEAANKLYENPEDWKQLRPITGDFRFHEFKVSNGYGLVLLSNFLHIYNENEARDHLEKSTGLLADDGVLLIHDYFPDRKTSTPHKGRLYDLNMMINTYNGICHESSIIVQHLSDLGFKNVNVIDLPSDSSIILASKKQTSFCFSNLSDGAPHFSNLVHSASEIGFRQTAILQTDKVITAPWVRKKCQNGCPFYNKGLQCPPHSMEYHETRQLLDSYNWAIVLEGNPPGAKFHKRLLELEKIAFLGGYHKTQVFGAGPCGVCEKCSVDDKCKNPGLARVSMEGAGIDVYKTTENAGIKLTPVTDKNQYVKYIGLLLVE